MSLSMVLPRLRVAAPEARSIVVAGVKARDGVDRLVQELTDTAGSLGLEARVLSVSGSEHGDGAALPASAFASAEKLRAALGAGEGLTIVSGGAILLDPPTLMVAATSDAVILTVRRGRTRRSDLAQAAADIERGGGHLAGTVLF